MSEGIISGLRNVEEKNRNYIQITASISPGSSGGAVVNSKGELIGISTMTIKGGQNLNFAIPVNDVMNVSLGSFSDKKYIDANNYFYKGYNALESGNYHDAIKYFNKYLEVFPSSAKAYYNRGNAYKDLGNYSDAISDYTKAIQLNPDLADAYFNRGIAYYDSGYPIKACSDWQKAYTLGDKDAKDLLDIYCK